MTTSITEPSTAALPAVSGKRIAFVLYNYPLGVSTMLINSIALLARDNTVDVYINETDRREHPCDPWLEDRLISYPDWRRHIGLRIVRKLCNVIGNMLSIHSSRLAWILSNLDILFFSRWFGRQISQQHYDILAPVECYSLIAIQRAGRSTADVIYYNMELLDWEPKHPLHSNKGALKQLEHQALSDVSHVMITSPERARIFAAINAFPTERISPLPVLPLSTATPTRSLYFRKKFDLSDTHLIVIYSGNFQPWAQCTDIIESVANWPAHAVLVMHTWSKPSANSPYFHEMREKAKGLPVYFSTDYILHKDLPAALSSADIGMLYYQAIDANFTEILFSSNKMAEYMAAGLPVLCSPFPALEQFVREEHIGIACDFSQLGQAIACIDADLGSYREHVGQCRNRHFRFEPHFDAAFAAYAAHATSARQEPPLP